MAMFLSWQPSDFLNLAAQRQQTLRRLGNGRVGTAHHGDGVACYCKKTRANKSASSCVANGRAT